MTEELVRNAKKEFGDECGQIIGYLTVEAAHLKMDWSIYRVFFGASEQRWDLLFETYPLIASTIERTLWEAIILRLCRLTDNKNNKGKVTMSLEQLRSSLACVETGREVGKLVKKAKVSVKPFRIRRDKEIAHSEFSYKTKLKQFEGVSRSEMSSAIDACCKPIEHIYEKLTGTHYLLSPSGPSEEAIGFLNLIYDGQKKLDQAWSEKNWSELESRPDWLLITKDDR